MEKPSSMNRESTDPDSPVIGYMCLIDFECEAGAACGGNVVYPSVDDLKRHHTCWEACGIAEVEIRGRKTIHSGKWGNE